VFEEVRKLYQVMLALHIKIGNLQDRANSIQQQEFRRTFSVSSAQQAKADFYHLHGYAKLEAEYAEAGYAYFSHPDSKAFDQHIMKGGK
jgi:hypothetical protein